MDEVIQIPHIASAKKRLRQNVKRRGLNRSKRAEIRKVLKQIRLLLEANDKQAATALLPALAKAVDKAAKRNTIHPNKAARIKSRWTQRIQAA
jgi:small subunit ribosomal protein S20